MKNSRIVLASILAVGLVAAHSQGLAGQTMPTGAVILKLDWPVGRHATQSMHMKMTSQISLPGSPQPMSQNLTMSLQSALTVSADPASGNHDVETIYTSAKMNMAMNGNPVMSFDSAASSTGDANPPAATFGKMIGSKVVFVLAPDNHVASVQGVDALQQAIAPSDPTGMMKGMFSADALKQQIDYSKFLPAKPVQPGDSWPVQIDDPMGTMGTMIMKYTLTLTAWDKHEGHWCAKMAVRGTINTKPGENPEIPGMKGMKMDIQGGTCSGDMWFDLDAGMFVDGTLIQDMKINMTVPNPMAQQPNAPAEMNMQDTMHQAVTTKCAVQ
jgi:hypothetical protein